MSERFDPLDHYPGILERSANYIDLQVQIRDRPNVTGVRLWISAHPHHLYGPRAGVPDSLMNTAVPAAATASRVALLQSRPNQITRSASIIRRRLMFGDVSRGICRFVFDPVDASVAEGVVLFAAIQQERMGLPVVTADGFTGRANQIKNAAFGDVGDPILGPIFVIPTVDQYSMAETTLVISAQAPAASAAMGVAGTTPNPHLDLNIVNPMHLIIPRPTTSITIRNTDAASALRVSLGLGQQIFEIPLGRERTFFGSVKEVCVQSAAAALCSFSIEANINLDGASGGR